MTETDRRALLEQLDEYLDAEGIRHFAAAEVAPHEIPPRELWPNIIPTLRVLEWLRERLDCPIYVSSGYRSPEHNREVGGAQASQHVRFAAVDFHSRGRHSVWEMAQALARHPEAHRMGIGAYADGHVHIDIRGYKARWSEPEGYWTWS